MQPSAKACSTAASANPIGAFAEAAAGGGSVNRSTSIGKIKLTNDGKAIQVSEAEIDWGARGHE